MGIGASIFLLAVGAILAFAVNAQVAGIDIQVVGWVLMGAGVIGLLMTLLVFAPRRRRLVRETGVPYGSVAPDGDLPVSRNVVTTEVRDDVV
ncbi:DUF6458 family protein [Longivirga aurantiaca]|uniref:DUF6458 family protein n=1 Tax=Longivirga aurantiaca TaxID=1837743 RepID=A0ABW1T5R7_9ACTN